MLTIFSYIIDAVASVAHALISAYVLIVIAACVVSWFALPFTNPFVRVLMQLTGPVFNMVRRRLPFAAFNGLDLTPLVVIVVLELIDLILIRSLHHIAMVLVV